MRRGIAIVAAVLVLCILVFRVCERRRDVEHVFACPGGVSIGATFANDSVRLRLPSGNAILPIARSASGARYANDTLEFWEHAGETRIANRGALALEHCRPAE